GLEHDLAYRGLVGGTLDAMDLYSTDAEIEYYGLRVLDDDLGHFPAYQAVVLYRDDVPAEVEAALLKLEGTLSEDGMIALNRQAKIDRMPEAEVAAGFVQNLTGTAVTVDVASRSERILRRTGEHLGLVLISLFAAILAGIPLGIIAYVVPSAGRVILGTVGAIYTIPSLALLVFMIPLLGIGAVPAMVALFLYSLLPIVRNTHAGLTDIPVGLRESALALGLPQRVRLRRILVPMAGISIIAGIQTAAVINVGTATLGALIGAGGYGQPILTGIRLDDTALILEGAIPAAVLALIVQGGFGLLGSWLGRWAEQ
ncbi:MAG: ABC transporter permease subunit, partial [Bacteroidota bacterium]